MKPWLRLFLIAVLPAAAHAADGFPAPAAKLHWRCWYDGHGAITCLVDTVPKASLMPTLFPGDVPPAVMTLRSDPGSLRGEVIRIPLHTEPYDMEFTALLAKATVCGAQRDCSVHFSDKLPPAEEIIALLDTYLPEEEDPDTTLASLEADDLLD